jgi:hypothetical protein
MMNVELVRSIAELTLVISPVQCEESFLSPNLRSKVIAVCLPTGQLITGKKRKEKKKRRKREKKKPPSEKQNQNLLVPSSSQV